MPTLSDWANLETDLVKKGIYENLITEDALMPMLQFQSMEGNSYVYNRENALPTATTHAVGDTWADTEPTWTKKTASLTIVGTQSPLDLYIKNTRGSVQDPKVVLYSSMSKAMVRKMGKYFIQGEPENVTTEFEGIDSLCRSETRMMAMDDGVVDGPGTAETELTLDRLDAMIDQIESGKPHALVMNKTMRRKVTALSRVSGSGVVMDSIEMFGHQVSTYDGIPILINEWITSAEIYNDSSTWSSSTATSIFALKFGEAAQGYTILHNGGALDFEPEFVQVKADKNEELYRIAVYVQAITYSAKMIAALGGIDSAA